MEDQNNPFEERQRKQHKTLNEKLKKKREKLKQHKKQKKIKHQAYDREKKRQEYFQKAHQKKTKDRKKDSYGIKVRKLKKTLVKFTKVYKDELKDFYDIWKGLDQGGEVEIDDIEDPHIRKCLKSMCKYLLLHRQGRTYTKSKQNVSVNLESYMKRKMEEVIEDYLENGTDSQDDEQSDEDVNQQKPKDNKQIKASTAVEQKSQPKVKTEKVHIGPSLPPAFNSGSNNQPRPVQIGPFIPREQRQKIEKMWDQSANSNDTSPKAQQQQQQDEIDKIFGYITTKKTQAQVIIRLIQPAEPQYRYAKGSAKMHQESNQQEAARFMEQYNRRYRNKSLVEQHREMLKNNQVEKTQTTRKPFTRQSLMSSDKVDMKRLNEMMQGGIFYDFKEKFTKPSDQKSFL